MAQFQISGKVQFMPGPWGVCRPLENASIEVIDVDANGSDDVIWSGTTNTNGEFSGNTSEWQDTTQIRVWVQDSLIPPRGHWETKNIPDPSDILLLKVRVKQDGRTHEVIPFVNSIPIVVPWGPPVIEKNGRALVVVNNTVNGGREELKFLYQFLELSGDAVAHTTLGPVYKSIVSLNGSQATMDGFCNALKTAAKTPGIQAVDAIINMHGSLGRLFFYEGGVPVETVQAKLEALNIKHVLRMVYNTCCYGSSHSEALCKGGFNAAIGARKINANSVSEYPLLLSLWAAGQPLNNALAVAQAPHLREPCDEAAREKDFTDVDSFKIIHGNDTITIGTVCE